MYKVLLIDDEKWVIEGLKTDIDWEKNGFVIAGQASSGMEALELIKKLEPDVAFVDIKMPGMNGLELIKKSIESGYKTQFIMASGYAEFTYAQKAMSYGAVGYCVKPFEEHDIRECLVRVKKVLGKAIPEEKAKMDILLESLEASKDENIRRSLKELGFDLNKEELLVVVTIGNGQILFTHGVESISFKLGISKNLYIIKSKYLLEVKDQLKKALSGTIKGIGYVTVGKQDFCLRASVDRATAAAYGFFITGEKGIFEPANSSFSEMNAILRKLEESVKNKDLPEIDNQFLILKKSFEIKSCDIRQVFHAYNILMSLCLRFSDGTRENYIDNFDQMVSIFENVYIMFDRLRDDIMAHLNSTMLNLEVDVENAVVNEILRYVNANFHKEMSVKSLSEKFFINPNYISQIFKKEVGMNFTEYLAKIRVNYACRLLKETRSSIQQISEKAGYNDYFYFTRVFKKAVGKTPSEYRDIS